MNLIRRNPFFALENEFNRLFDTNAENNFGWKPEVDIWETEGEVIAEAECAGLAPEDLNVSVQDGVLTITGEKRSGSDANKNNYHLIERSYGRFSRSFTLPRSVDVEKINAEYKNGVIRLTMAKREETKARKIEIQAETVPKAIGKSAGA